MSLNSRKWPALGRGGETDRKQLTRVVILIFEPFNDPLMERDQDDAVATRLSTKVKTTLVANSTCTRSCRPMQFQRNQKSFYGHAILAKLGQRRGRSVQMWGNQRILGGSLASRSIALYVDHGLDNY